MDNYTNEFKDIYKECTEEYSNECINEYNCPDCNEAKLQSDKNARKINEVIDQVNTLIQINNETVDFIHEKVKEVIEDETGTNTGANVDLSNYVTKTELDSKVDKETGKSLISDSEIERLSTLKNYDDTDVKHNLNSKADKTELHNHSNKTVLDGITSTKITEWNNKSTFNGNYNNLTNKPTIPTKTSQLTNDSGFITSVPSEYVTETELNNKGYLTQHQDLSNYATKTQVNAFNTLTLGINKNDGLMYIYKQGVPMGLGLEIGVKGDIIGYIDSDNSIILSGSLANDTYTVKYEMEDGTYVDIGSLSLGNTTEIINQIPLSIGSDGKPFNGGQGWKTGYRLSGSSGNESSGTGVEVTGFIPCKVGDTIYIKGITDDGTHVMGIYDSSFVTVATASIKEKFTLDGSVVSVTINSNFSSIKDETNTAYFRISANTIDNNSIITVNQPLT